MVDVKLNLEIYYHDVIHTYGPEKEFKKNIRFHLNNFIGPKPRYRIYVDSEMIVERVWHWGNDHYLKEHLILGLDKNIDHTFEFEPLFCEDMLQYPIVMKIKNLQISKATIINQLKNKVTFRLA